MFCFGNSSLIYWNLMLKVKRQQLGGFLRQTHLEVMTVELFRYPEDEFWTALW
jgi:hypothetical protein